MNSYSDEEAAAQEASRAEEENEENMQAMADQGAAEADIEAAKEAAFHAGYDAGYEQGEGDNAQAVQEAVLRAFPELRLKNQILQLPDRIKEQQLDMTKCTADIEEGRLELEKIKNGHREFVLNAKEGDKPRFGNDKVRDLAVAMLLQDDKAYNDLLDSTRNKERLQRLAEIDLKHLEDLFRAYLAVAGMTGVR